LNEQQDLIFSIPRRHSPGAMPQLRMRLAEQPHVSTSLAECPGAWQVTAGASEESLGCEEAHASQGPN
jgi:hypothetical protein